MKVEKIDHVAINVKDLKKAAQFFADLLGTEFSSPAVFKELDLTSLIEPLGIELVEPLTPDGPTARTIEQRGEGLSLISLKVTNVEEAMAEMKSRGVRLVTLIDRPKMKAAIYHPKDTFGVMIELIEYQSEHPTVAIREDE
jgi:methylmalonyl-CoA/ethylmalonyl-CoA epimerase